MVTHVHSVTVVVGRAPEPMPWGGFGAQFQDPFGNRFFITGDR